MCFSDFCLLRLFVEWASIFIAKAYFLPVTEAFEILIDLMAIRSTVFMAYLNELCNFLCDVMFTCFGVRDCEFCGSCVDVGWGREIF